jgi:hypothetical protein
VGVDGFVGCEWAVLAFPFLEICGQGFGWEWQWQIGEQSGVPIKVSELFDLFFQLLYLGDEMRLCCFHIFEGFVGIVLTNDEVF